MGLTLLVTFTALAALPAQADPGVRTLRGTLTEQAFTEGCTSPVNLCAAGEVKGGIHGPLELTVDSMTPTSNPDIVFLETSYVIHTNQGDLFFSGNTLLNTETGDFSALDTITGGTGKWEGTTGVLVASGNFNSVTGVGEADYEATIDKA